MVYLCSICVISILDSGSKNWFRDFMGWLLVGVCSLSIVLNLYFVLTDFILILIDNFRTLLKYRRWRRYLVKWQKDIEFNVSFSPE